MNRLVDLASYSRGGEYIMLGLLVIGIVLGVIGTVNLVRSSPRWEGHADGRSIVFTDMHAAMTELRSGSEALAEARLSSMRQTAAGSGASSTIPG